MALDVSIVLVCYNSIKHLAPCLNSVYSSESRFSFEVIVVDNNSTDGSSDAIERLFPNVRLIRKSQNLGFAAGCNSGIESSRGRYVLLLNCDTLFDLSSLDEMVAFMDLHPDGGAAGGRLLNPDGSFQSGYSHFSTPLQELNIALGLAGLICPGYPAHHDSDEVVSVDWICAACILIRRSVFDEMGLLDEDYFMYSEEVDFQYRLKSDGWKIYYIPNIETIHMAGGNQNRWTRRQMVYRGKMLFYRKNYTRYKEILLRATLFLVSLTKLLFWCVARLGSDVSSRARTEIRSYYNVLKLTIRPI